MDAGACIVSAVLLLDFLREFSVNSSRNCPTCPKCESVRSLNSLNVVVWRWLALGVFFGYEPEGGEFGSLMRDESM